MAAQLGKPITIQEVPSLLSHLEFLKRSKYPYDTYGSAHTALLRVVSSFREVWAHTLSVLEFSRERKYQESVVFVGARYKHVRIQDKS